MVLARRKNKAKSQRPELASNEELIEQGRSDLSPRKDY